MRILLAAAAVLAGTAAFSGAQALEGTFVSLDDEQLMEAGHIVPVFEYIEIAPDAAGALTLEVGYLHAVTRAEDLPLHMVRTGEDGTAVAAPDIGVLEPGAGRRVTLRGPVTVGDGTLAWTADLLAPSSHEPGRTEARPSPFLAAAAGPQASVDATLSGDLLVVTDGDGAVHRYRRTDPDLIRMTGLLAFIANQSYARVDACLAPMAAALVSGTPYRFSDATLALSPEDLATSEEILFGMRQRGLGKMLHRLVIGAARANEAAGLIVAAELARYPSFADYVAANGGTTSVSDPDLQLRLFAVTRLHAVEAADLDRPFAFDQAATREWLEARYDQDPWAVTTPYLAAVTRDNWISAMLRMLHHEIDVLCPPQ